MPTLPKDRMLGLLPTLPTSFIVPTPTSLAQYASSSERRDWGKKPGHASSSENWIKDKTLGGASPSKSRDREKVLGRASLSENWVKDKMIGRLLSDESGERVGHAPARGSWNGGKRPASHAPSADQCDKKPRPEMEVDSAAQLFAGPTFIVSPNPSALPIPCFVKAH